MGGSRAKPEVREAGMCASKQSMLVTEAEARSGAAELNQIAPGDA